MVASFDDSLRSVARGEVTIASPVRLTAPAVAFTDRPGP